MRQSRLTYMSVWVEWRENISFAITLHNKKIIITSVYSPRHDAHFRAVLRLITGTYSDCIILGDLNARNCLSNDASGNVLYNFLNSSDFCLLAPSSLTHYPHAGSASSTIDTLLGNSTLPGQIINTISWRIISWCVWALVWRSTNPLQSSQKRFSGSAVTFPMRKLAGKLVDDLVRRDKNSNWHNYHNADAWTRRKKVLENLPCHDDGIATMDSDKDNALATVFVPYYYLE